MSQIRKGTLLYTVCRIKILLLAWSAIEATLTPVWYRALSEEALRFYANDITPWLNFLSFSISLTMWTLFISALTKELRMTRILWIIPILRVLVNALNIFLTSQSMIRMGNYCMQSLEILCLVLLTAVLWQYRGFTEKNT